MQQLRLPRWYLITTAALLALAISSLLRQAPAIHAQSVTEAQWQAQYWSNTTLAGPPVVTRTEPTPNHNWGEGAPEGTGLPADRFSARWQTTLTLPAGRYAFTVRADDGVRLWVDGNQLINEWTVQSAESFTAEMDLDGSAVAVRLDYFENTGVAFISLDWRRIDGGAAEVVPTTTTAVGAPVNLWRGEYFADPNLTEFAFERNDPDLNFNWESGSPDRNALGDERFSVRWTRTLALAPGRYQFTATADDGVRVWVNEALIIDEWTIQAARSFEAFVEVTGGATPVRVEYFENTGQAQIAVTWRQVGPVVVTPTPSATPAFTGDFPTATMTGARYLNIRQGPGIRYGRTTIIADGAVVEYLGRAPAGIWVQIRLADGTVGWANSRYFTSDTPVVNLPVVP